jgi:hypothetical protein
LLFIFAAIGSALSPDDTGVPAWRGIQLLHKFPLPVLRFWIFVLSMNLLIALVSILLLPLMALGRVGLFAASAVPGTLATLVRLFLFFSCGLLIQELVRRESDSAPG